MGYPTSSNGLLQITALSFTPAVVAMGEPVTMNVTIKNVSGVDIKKIRMALKAYYPTTERGTSEGWTPDYVIKGTTSANGDVVQTSFVWNKNTSKTFKYTFTPKAGGAPFDNGRTARLDLYTYSDQYMNVTGKTPEHFYNLQGEDNEFLALINKRYAPLLNCEIYRAVMSDETGQIEESDESTMLAMDAKATFGSAYDKFFGETEFAQLYWSSGGDIDISTASPDYVLSADELSELRLGISKNTSFLNGLYAELGQEYTFTMVYGDAYEISILKNYNVGVAFANLHLSGRKTGGACFGGFSTSTNGDPKLESYYPGYFYKGISGVNIFSEDEVLTGGRWVDNKPICRRVIRLPAVAADRTSTEAVATIENLDQMIDFYGTVQRTNGSWYPLSFRAMGNVAAYAVDVYVKQDGGVVLRTGTSTALNGGHMVCYYTRTIDQPIDPNEGYEYFIDIEDSYFITADDKKLMTEV